MNEYNVPEIWKENIEHLRKGREEKNLFELAKAHRFLLVCVCSWSPFRISPEMLEEIIPVIVEFATDSEMSPIMNLYEGILGAGAELLKKFPWRPLNINISFDRIYNWYKSDVKEQRESLDTRDQRDYGRILEFIESLSDYFSEEDANRIVDMFLHKIGGLDTSCEKAFQEFLMFLPASALPRVIEPFMTFVDNMFSPYSVDRILRYFHRCVRRQALTTPMDWSSYALRIIASGFTVMDPVVTIVDEEISTLNGMTAITSYEDQGRDFVTWGKIFASMLVYSRDRTSVLNHLERLMQIMTPNITPAAGHDPMVYVLAGFCTSLDTTVKRQCRIYKHCPERENVPLLSEAEKTRLAGILVMPVKQIITVLKPKHWSDWMVFVMSTLFWLSYEKAFNDLFLYAIENMEDPEEGPMSQACKHILRSVFQMSMSGEHTKDTLYLVPKLFDILVPTLHSTVRPAGRMSFRLLNELASLFYVDPSKAEGLTMRERMIVNTFISHFDACVASDVAKASFFAQQNDEKENVTHPFFLDCGFFAAYSSNFIESKLPWIFDKLATSHPNSKGYGMIRQLSKAHPSLIKKIVSMSIDKFHNSSDIMHKFWGATVSATCVITPTFMEAWPMYRDFIREIVTSNEEDRFKFARSIIQAIFNGVRKLTSTDIRCAPIEDNIANMWGRLFSEKEVDAKLYYMNNDDARTVANSILEIVEPLFAEIDSYKPKQQMSMCSILGSMGRYMMRSSSFLRNEPSSNEDDKYYWTLLNLAKNVLEKSTYDEVKEKVLENLTKLVNPSGGCHDSVVRPSETWKFTGNTRSVLVCREIQIARVIGTHNYMETLQYFSGNKSVVKYLLDDVFDAIIDKPVLLGLFKKLLDNARWLLFAPEDVDYAISKICAAIKTNGMTNRKASEKLFSLLLPYLVTWTDPSVFKKLVEMLVTVRYDASSKVIDTSISEIVEFIPYVMTRMSTARSCDEILLETQKSLFSLERGTIPERWYTGIATAFATCGPKMSLDVFKYLWNILLADDGSRKDEIVQSLGVALKKLLPKRKEMVFDHRPEEEYMMDDIGNCIIEEPKHIKIAVGPGFYPEDYKHAEIRDWIAKHLTGDVIAYLITSLSLLLDEAPETLDRETVDMWARLYVIAGPSVIDSLQEIVESDDGEEITYSITLVQAVVGLSDALVYWTKEDGDRANELVVMPFFRRYITRNLDTGDVLMYMGYVCADKDYRRNLWFWDMIREIGMDQPEIVHRNMALAICRVVEQFHPSAYESTVNKYVKEVFSPDKILSYPKSVYQSLSYLTIPLSNGLAMAKYNLDIWSFVFEIFDADKDLTHLEKTSACFENFRLFGREGTWKIIDGLAVGDRLVRLFKVRHGASPQIAEIMDDFYTLLGCELAWSDKQETLNTLFTDLMKYYPTAPWITRTKILKFIHLICFQDIMLLDRSFYLRVFNEAMPLMLQDENTNIREQAIKFARMLIHVGFDSLDNFYEMVTNEKNTVMAVAYSVVLLGAVSIIHGCPKWLPELMMNLEEAHHKVISYAKIIEQAFADFWKCTGPIVIPEIEDFRYAFSQGYFA